MLDYNNSFNVFKYNMEQLENSVTPNKNVSHKQITSLKNIINSLTKQNEKLTEDLADLKKIDRINHVYKNLFEKFAEQLKNNKK